MSTDEQVSEQECPGDCGEHCGSPAWTRADHDARADRLRPLADYLRTSHDVPDEDRRYRDTWLNIALIADEWFERRERDQPILRAVESIVAGRVGDALREAADAALTMYDPPVHECIEWSEWLRARADYGHTRPAGGGNDE